MGAEWGGGETLRCKACLFSGDPPRYANDKYGIGACGARGGVRCRGGSVVSVV